jgi:hypothetical protein
VSIVSVRVQVLFPLGDSAAAAHVNEVTRVAAIVLQYCSCWCRPCFVQSRQSQSLICL